MNAILKELREKQAVLVTNARAKLDEVKADTPEVRAKEIEGEYDAMMAEYDRLEERARREERQAAVEAAMNEADARRPRGEDRSTRESGRSDSGAVDYRTAFYKFLSVGGDVSELSSEVRSVLRSGVSEARAQNVGTGSAGGYTVPTELANFIAIAMKMEGPMYDEDLCTTIVTTGGNPIKIPTIDDTASVAVAHTEGTALTDDGGSDVTFGQASLDAYAFDTEFVRWSWESTQDSVVNFEQLLGTLLGKRLGKIANSKLTTGSGSSDVKGIVTASTLGKTAAATAAITSDEILDLVHSVDPAYRGSPKTRFMFNDQTLLAISKLKDGNGNYLLSQGDFTKGVPGTILGYRYSINQAMDSLAAAKKVMLFGDFSHFYVRKVGAPVMGVMRERFWPDLGIAGLIRFDGEIGINGAVKHLITAAS